MEALLRFHLVNAPRLLSSDNSRSRYYSGNRKCFSGALFRTALRTCRVSLFRRRVGRVDFPSALRSSECTARSLLRLFAYRDHRRWLRMFWLMCHGHATPRRHAYTRSTPPRCDTHVIRKTRVPLDGVRPHASSTHGESRIPSTQTKDCTTVCFLGVCTIPSALLAFVAVRRVKMA